MKLGIISCYFSKYGIDEGSRRMKSHGYDCVDYQNFIDIESDFFNLSERDFEKQLKEERKIIESNGIVVHQAHAPWRDPKDLLPSDRLEWFEAMSKAIKGCAHLGSKNLVIHPLMPFGANNPENPEEVRKINFEFMSNLCEVAKEYNITICYENMPFRLFPISTAIQVTDFAKQINSKYFKVCLDTGHALVCGEKLANAVRYIGKELLGALHVHDNNGERDSHLFPGKGIGDWEAFSAALQEIGFEGAVSFETEVSSKYTPEEQDRLERELAVFGKQIAHIT